YIQVAVYNAQAWSATVIPYAIAVIVFGSIVAIGARLWSAARAGRGGMVYPDGSFVDGSNVVFPFGEVRPLKNASLTDGAATVTWSADGVETREGSDRVVWRPDGRIDGVV